MVFFLIEDAVTTSTLASKLVRQATKWDGHGAFLILHNGYVFNGPQTATILLAELSKIRLQRDEDASTFCLHLVELIEDLELVPGELVPSEAAVLLIHKSWGTYYPRFDTNLGSSPFIYSSNPNNFGERSASIKLAVSSITEWSR